MGVVRGLIISGASSDGSTLPNKKNYNRPNKCNTKSLDHKINNFNYSKPYVNAICRFLFSLLHTFAFNTFTKCALKCFWYVAKSTWTLTIVTMKIKLSTLTTQLQWGIHSLNCKYQSNKMYLYNKICITKCLTIF